MQINSTTTNPMIGQAFKSSPKNNEAAERQLDIEIQNLEQAKADLSKEIFNINGDFAPPKPKQELIRPLKDKIKIIEAKIHQKQAEKMKKQAENLVDPSSKTNDNKSIIMKKNDIEGKSFDSAKDKNKSTFEQLSNFTTQTGIINEVKVKNSLKDSSNLLLKETTSSNVSNTSEYKNSINNNKNNKHVKNAIDAYSLIENTDSVDSTVHVLA